MATEPESHSLEHHTLAVKIADLFFHGIKLGEHTSLDDEGSISVLNCNQQVPTHYPPRVLTLSASCV
jgi:hypothetical protein